MVVISNECQNKCEDVPKTTAITGTTTHPTASTPSSSSTASFVAPSETNPAKEININAKIKNKSEIVALDFITPANDNDSNEHINEIKNDENSTAIAYKNEINHDDDDDDDKNECKVGKVGKVLFTSAKQLTVLKYNNNNNKIMTESSKESPLKEENDMELHLENDINNHNNKYLDELNLCQNSNTNTPITTLKTPQHNYQQHIITQQQQQPHLAISSPLTPQALSGALQSTLSTTNNSVAAAGLQPNFLSQLALTANVTTAAASILTAKQLNNSFNMDSNNQNKSDSNLLEGTTLPSSVPAATYDNNGQAKIVLICEGNSHPFQSRTISLTPNVECMVGRLIAKSKASENNAIFDCKVLSRKHAVIWYTPDGKFWVKDTKSSNGTFINDNKLGDEEAELHFGDIVKFGVDVLENSRKEVHGCIIACVKLYLSDGREAISIDSSVHRSQYSGEGRISCDELHRLNLYIQETSQREKILTSKLCNIQNVLDATRKNSALCWQSMITEDQLLHRINSLEKKLQFMEKNVPENVLRNEILKLLDDKSSYQNTAKEALRKVYQERCEAMQMLAKMESAYTQSDNECSLLRDQIMNSKQTLQDVNSRLLRIETDYNEYKDEVARQQQEAKDREEERITMLTEKLHERELESEDLKKKISEFLVKRAEGDNDEEKSLEKQTIEKVDAADMGDVDSEEISEDANKEEEEATEFKFTINRKKSTVRPQLATIFGDQLNGLGAGHQQENSKLKNANASDTARHKSPPKRVKETTIMKWLQNSDLNKSEESFNIFKAICNENENDDDSEDGIFTEQELKDSESIEIPNSHVNETNLFNAVANKLKHVQKNLKQLESEIEKETKTKSNNADELKGKSVQQKDKNNEQDDAKEGACARGEYIIESNGKTSKPAENLVLSEEYKKYLLLKSSVNVLREVYNETWDIVKDRKENGQYHEKDKSLSTIAETKTGSTIVNLESQTKVRSPALDNTESDSEIESATPCSSVNSSRLTVSNIETDAPNDQIKDQLREYQSQVIALNEKLQLTELEAQHTLEIMQVECDDVKLKMESLNKMIEALKNDKKSLEKVIHEYQNNGATFETASSNSTIALKDCEENDAQLAKEFELEEDNIFNAINVTALEREEELITYKERLEEQQRANIDLRNEIALLKQKTKGETTKDLLLKQYLPCSIIVLAIIIYFLSTYY